ncbi:MAG: hypothetical protein KY442_05995, partial [Proteobacteria bacterium]|nr:hypothetical protein [Pseudomonadota bacterium]
MNLRISTAGLHAQGLNGLLQRQQELARTQQEMISGTRINRAADDPAAASNAQRLDHAVAALEQYDRNSGLLEHRLRLQEGALEDAGDNLRRARELAIQANVLDGRDMSLNFGFVADRTRGEITEFNRPCYRYESAFFMCEGATLGQMYGHHFYRSLDELPADVVVGFGGYVALPAYLAARRRGTPTDAVRLDWPTYGVLAATTLLHWAWSATTFTVYLQAFPGLATVPLLEVAGSFLLAWVVGFLAIFAPQGAGAFELAAAAMLVGTSGAAAVA